MNPGDRILRSPYLALAPADDGYLAYDIESSRLHRLNLAAALIVELSNGIRTEADVCTELGPLLGGAGPEAYLQWIEAAKTEGLLRAVQTGDPPPATPSPRDFVSRASQLREEGYVLGAFTCQHYATLLLPDEADQWYTLGELAHTIGRREDAREAYEQYFKLTPDDAEIEQILISLRNEPAPPRAPNRCIEQLYSRFAEHYEESMCGNLGYEGPARLSEALDAELGSLRDLDVLELGCGTGLAGRYLRTRARRLVAIDLSREMVTRAQTTGLYDHIDVAEITEWLSRPEIPHFHLITACDTLIYFGDLRQVILPAAKRLYQGGRLAFTVERGERDPFRLTDSGRYEHTEVHVRTVAEEASLTVASLTEGFLRYEYGEPVAGLVAILRR